MKKVSTAEARDMANGLRATLWKAKAPPPDQDWDPAQLRAAMEAAGYKGWGAQSALARHLGVNGRTVRGWLEGRARIQQWARTRICEWIAALPAPSAPQENT